MIDETLIGGTTGVVRAGSAAVRAVQSGFVRYYAALLVLGVAGVGFYFLLQSLMPPLSIMLWLPAACGLLGALLPSGAARVATPATAPGGEVRRPASPAGLLALLGSLAALGLAIAYIADYRSGHGLQHVTDVMWIRALGIHYKLAVTGLNVILVGMATLLFAAAILASNVRASGPPERPRLFYFQLLLAESAVMGAFLAQDLILFVAFFDLMLIPFYFLIGGWERDPEGSTRVRATTKLVIYTLVGSLLMLAGAIAAGVLSRAAERRARRLRVQRAHPHAARARLAGVDLPALRRRLPREDARLPAARLDARRLSRDARRGADGLLGRALEGGRLRLPRDRAAALPRAAVHFQTLMLLIGLVSIIYGSLQAFSQTDARLIAGYSSVAQLGFITLGIFALNEQGAQGGLLLQMVNHGLVVAPLLFIAGLLGQRAGGSEDIRRMGGIAFRAPVLATMFLIVALATLAIPGSSQLRRRVPDPARRLQGEARDRDHRLHRRRAGERLRAAAVHPRDAQPRRLEASTSREITLARRARARTDHRRDPVHRAVPAARAASAAKSR